MATPEDIGQLVSNLPGPTRWFVLVSLMTAFYAWCFHELDWSKWPPAAQQVVQAWPWLALAAGVWSVLAYVWAVFSVRWLSSHPQDVPIRENGPMAGN